MKASEAPEKIYFEVNNNLIGLYDSAILGMFSVKKNKTAIEYTRTDAFIEKVVKWLDDNAVKYWGTDAVDNGMMIYDCKKAMKS